MHGDAVVRVLGQLVESTGRGAVDVGVKGREVADQWSHSIGLSKPHPVVTPHATPREGMEAKISGQLAPIHCISHLAMASERFFRSRSSA